MRECLEAAVAAPAAPADAARLLSDFHEATGDPRGAKQAAFLRLRALQAAGWHSDAAAVEQVVACFEQLCRCAVSAAGASPADRRARPAARKQRTVPSVWWGLMSAP